MRQTCPGHLGPELPAQLAAHPDDSGAYEDWKAWRQRRRNWFLEHGLTYDFVEDLQLRRYVRDSGGTWIQPSPAGRGGSSRIASEAVRSASPFQLRGPRLSNPIGHLGCGIRAGANPSCREAHGLQGAGFVDDALRLTL
jgi:hypothetical protein